MNKESLLQRRYRLIGEKAVKQGMSFTIFERQPKSIAAHKLHKTGLKWFV